MIPGLNTRIPNNEFCDPIGMFFWGDDTIEFTDKEAEDGETSAKGENNGR